MIDNENFSWLSFNSNQPQIEYVKNLLKNKPNLNLAIVDLIEILSSPSSLADSHSNNSRHESAQCKFDQMNVGLDSKTHLPIETSIDYQKQNTIQFPLEEKERHQKCKMMKKNQFLTNNNKKKDLLAQVIDDQYRRILLFGDITLQRDKLKPKKKATSSQSDDEYDLDFIDDEGVENANKIQFKSEFKDYNCVKGGLQALVESSCFNTRGAELLANKSDQQLHKNIIKGKNKNAQKKSKPKGFDSLNNYPVQNKENMPLQCSLAAYAIINERKLKNN